MTAIFAVILVLIVFVGMRNGQEKTPEQNPADPIDIDDMEREMTDPNEWNAEDILSDLIDGKDVQSNEDNEN